VARERSADYRLGACSHCTHRNPTDEFPAPLSIPGDPARPACGGEAATPHPAGHCRCAAPSFGAMRHSVGFRNTGRRHCDSRPLSPARRFASLGHASRYAHRARLAPRAVRLRATRRRPLAGEHSESAPSTSGPLPPRCAARVRGPCRPAGASRRGTAFGRRQAADALLPNANAPALLPSVRHGHRLGAPNTHP
jgi:hypothetical protein